MKRLTSSFLLGLLLTAAITAATVISASALNTDDWYEYNGSSAAHTFSLRFPTNWKIKIYSDELQGLQPISANTESYVLIREHEGKSYAQAIAGTVSNVVELVKEEDFIFTTINGDIPAKNVVYRNIELDETFSKTFVKRGGLIIALTNTVEENPDQTIQAIHDSFRFTDDWHQYINLKEGYTFIYPTSFGHTNTDTGVVITDPAHEELVIFGITNESGELAFVQTEELPTPEYYEDYINEMMESFEFFIAARECSDYRNFPDVCDEHVNVEAINSLYEGNIIDGYPDGTFKPDGEINRAELTKMIVAVMADPDSAVYKDCFTDVADEWFAPYVCYAAEQGWVEGYTDGEFKPSENINRAEALKVLLEVLLPDAINENVELTDMSVLDVDLEAWYGQYFTIADNNGVLDKQHIVEEPTGYRYFPGSDISRKEVAETIYRTQNLQ